MYLLPHIFYVPVWAHVCIDTSPFSGVFCLVNHARTHSTPNTHILHNQRLCVWHSKRRQQSSVSNRGRNSLAILDQSRNHVVQRRNQLDVGRLFERPRHARMGPTARGRCIAWVGRNGPSLRKATRRIGGPRRPTRIGSLGRHFVSPARTGAPISRAASKHGRTRRAGRQLALSW